MTDNVIELTDVHFAYDRTQKALDGLNWRLEKRQRVGIWGPNGSGKSTMFLIALGLIKPASGRVRVFGRERQTDRDFRSVRGRVGLLFQNSDDQLFCPTVAEDVAFGPINLGKNRHQALDIVQKTLKLLGLDGFQDRYCHKLSGGEKRLVSLATVLAMEPEVLLLDEPTTGLDEETVERILEFLQNYGQTLAIVSHDRRFLEWATENIYRLEDGRIEAG